MHIKSIVQSKRAIGFENNPHVCEFIDGNVAVDENHKPIQGNPNMGQLTEERMCFSNENNTEKIALIHFVTKSEEEFHCRTIRGKAFGIWNLYDAYLFLKKRVGM